MRALVIVSLLSGGLVQAAPPRGELPFEAVAPTQAHPVPSSAAVRRSLVRPLSALPATASNETAAAPSEPSPSSAAENHSAALPPAVATTPPVPEEPSSESRPTPPLPVVPPAPPSQAVESSAAAADDLNFNLFGKEEQKSPLDEARRRAQLARLEHRAHLRRQLLLWHQALGFVTLGALAVTDVIGTLSYYDKYVSTGTDTGKFTTWHEGLGIGTTAAFGVTGLLALLAPNPYPKPLRLDAALIHKITMALAAACFTAQVVMGPIMAVSDGKLYQRDLALAHLVIGYGAFAFMGAGTLAFVF